MAQTPSFARRSKKRQKLKDFFNRLIKVFRSLIAGVIHLLFPRRRFRSQMSRTDAEAGRSPPVNPQVFASEGTDVPSHVNEVSSAIPPRQTDRDPLVSIRAMPLATGERAENRTANRAEMRAFAMPTVAPLMLNDPPSTGEITRKMLDDLVKISGLDEFLPEPPPLADSAMPKRDVAVVSVTEKSVGLGNRLGSEVSTPFSTNMLKGGRLDAVVRFQVWAEALDFVANEMKQVHSHIQAAKDSLWAAGFLRLVSEEVSLEEFVPNLNVWRQTTSYRVLYEFRYPDNEGAESLIARIPITINSEYGELTTVADDMVRWDNQATPALEVYGGGSQGVNVGAISMLAFLPTGWDGKPVTVSAVVRGVEQTRTFASLRAFFNAFVLESKTVRLGVNDYQVGSLRFPNPDFPNPITLHGNRDVFRVTYGDPADHSTLDGAAVVYLRVLN